MNWKYSIITGFMGRLRDRFIEYQPARPLAERLDRIARVARCAGAEVVYPVDFEDPAALKQMLAERSLGVSAVNLNVKADDLWRGGSFTSPDRAVRDEAARWLTVAMDHARALGCGLVTSAFLNDGSDYPFELDYRRAWDDAVESVARAATHDPSVRVALEYKASEPKAHCFLPNAGKAACFAAATGCDNVGVTLDVGHALQAQEIPADSVAFLAALGRLFYVHTNDNYRNWDWDLVPATVNLWDFVELAFHLRRAGYDGWIAADVFPRRHDGVIVFERTFQAMDAAIALAGRIDADRLADLQGRGDTMTILDDLRRLLGAG